MKDYRVHLLGIVDWLVANLVHQDVFLSAILYLHQYLPFLAGYKVLNFIWLPSLKKTPLRTWRHPGCGCAVGERAGGLHPAYNGNASRPYIRSISRPLMPSHSSSAPVTSLDL